MPYLPLLLTIFLLMMLLAWAGTKILLPRSVSTSAIALATIGFWVSLILSYRPVINTSDTYDATTPIATGGFPMTALHYPPTPLGSDYPPIESWPLFFLNYGIWIVICIVLSKLLTLYYPKIAAVRLLPHGLVMFSLTATLVGCVYLLFRFD